MTGERQGPVDEAALRIYLCEYEQCMESYRHTYATIWQASAVFAAISGGLLAFAKDRGSALQAVAPLPFLFWFLGIFRPMNRYGEMRNDRLARIEEILSAKYGVEMEHFRKFSGARKRSSTLMRLFTLKLFIRPRVVEVVSAFGFALIAVQIYLIIRAF